MVRLMSWNIARAAGARLDAVAALIRAHGPDLFLAQEATEDIRGLVATLGGHVHFEPAFPIAANADEGMAIWSPAPLDGIGRLALGGWPWPRVALWCRLGPMTVCNLHLAHLPWQRARQLRTVSAALPRPLVMAGDFNRPGGCRLTGFASAVPAGWSFARGPLRLRLDAALASSGVAVTGARYLDSAASDHKPLLMTLAAGA